MKHLFARRPLPEFAQYSSSHLGAGTQYQRRFSEQPGRALMCELEKALLSRIVDELRPASVLDFACGTGRISAHVEEQCPGASIHGIDISDSMLQLARNRGGRTEYRLMSSTEAISAFGKKAFDLILAFRFFANAEHALRVSIADDLVRLLDDGGSLVVNNHRNFWSTSYLMRRITGEAPLGALDSDIENLFAERGLSLKKRFSLGLWPQGDTHAALLPWSAVSRIERANLSRLSQRHSLGYNTIWILSK